MTVVIHKFMEEKPEQKYSVREIQPYETRIKKAEANKTRRMKKIKL